MKIKESREAILIIHFRLHDDVVVFLSPDVVSLHVNMLLEAVTVICCIHIDCSFSYVVEYKVIGRRGQGCDGSVSTKLISRGSGKLKVLINQFDSQLIRSSKGDEIVLDYQFH